MSSRILAAILLLGAFELTCDTLAAKEAGKKEAGKIVYIAPFGGTRTTASESVGNGSLIVDFETHNVSSGHLGFVFEDCRTGALRYCISSVGFCFAVPANLEVGQAFEACRWKFTITARRTIEFRGEERSVYDISGVHSSGATHQRFVYDKKFGLIALAEWSSRGLGESDLPNIRVLDGRYGLGADPRAS